jgi:hypothetical protein
MHLVSLSEDSVFFFRQITITEEIAAKKMVRIMQLPSARLFKNQGRRFIHFNVKESITHV